MSDIENQETAAFNFKQKAEKYLSQGKLDEAYANCSKALEISPNSGEIYKILGNIWERMGQLESAKKSYKQAIQYNSNLAEVHANLGSISARQEQWEQAIKYYEKAISIRPNFPGFYRNLAKIWQCLGKEQLVTECRYQALILEPKLATATEWLNLGDKLLELDKREEAIACFYMAIELDKKLSLAYQNLGELLIKSAKLESALVVLKQGIKMTPKNPRYYYLLGEVFQEKKEYDLAIPAYRYAIELKSDNHLFHKKLGDVFHKKGELKSAIVCYQKAIEINSDFFWSYYSLGNIYTKQQQWDEAIAAYYKATIINPKFHQLYFYLGNAFLHKIQNDKAVDAYLAAIKLKPEHPWFSNYSTLWKFLVSQGQLQPILKLYQNATKLNPNSVLCYVNLGEIFTEIGNIDAAITCYQTACYNKISKSHPTFVEKNWNSQNTRRPNFIIIGAQKSGTTSLENYIVQHPQVIPAIKKETHFWYRDFSKGINWYLAHFPPIPNSQNFITGEATPNYLEYYQSAKRIYSVFPNIKLLVILRNPVDRAVSQYHHWVRIKREERSFEKAIDAELEMLLKNLNQPQGDRNYWQQQPGNYNYIGRGVYVEFIKKWMEIFPREQFIILKGEDLYEQPITTMKQVFDFLGLPEHQLQKYRKLNAGYYQPINQSVRQRLSEYFQPHNHRLEEYLGIKFNW